MSSPHTGQGLPPRPWTRPGRSLDADMAASVRSKASPSSTASRMAATMRSAAPASRLRVVANGDRRARWQTSLASRRPSPAIRDCPRRKVCRRMEAVDSRRAISSASSLSASGPRPCRGSWASDAPAQEPLQGLGPEADRLDADEMARLLSTASMRLHTFLRRQSLIAGLGRRLANEVCHRARLSPFATTRSLDAGAAERIVAAIREAVDEGLAFERTLAAMSASKDRPGRVHGRGGKPCPVCGDDIRTVEYRAYTVAYCPTCQTEGKVLADNP